MRNMVSVAVARVRLRRVSGFIDRGLISFLCKYSIYTTIYICRRRMTKSPGWLSTRGIEFSVEKGLLLGNLQGKILSIKFKVISARFSHFPLTI